MKTMTKLRSLGSSAPIRTIWPKVRHHPGRFLGLVVVLALVAAACGASDSAEMAGPTAPRFDDADASDFAANTADTASTGEGFAGDEAEAPETDALGRNATGTETLQVVEFGRDIIFTAQVTVAVSDVGTAGTAATNAVQALGGFVFGQQTTGGREARSTLIFKIAPDNFQAALASFGDLGEVRTQNVNAQDVTDRVVDLESRVSTAEASVERLKGFLSEAGDIDTIAELESQLLDRETTLEVLRGQIRTLQDAVSLATITLTLTEALSNPQMQVQVSAYESTDDAGVSCHGSQDIEVLEGESVTLCFEIFNTGDTLLSGFTLRDGALDLDLEDLTVVWGDLQENLEPGESIVLSTEVLLERTIRAQTRITAIPVNEDGQRVEAREVSNTTSIFLGTQDPGGLPGFADGLESSWDLLQNLGGLFVLLAGLIVPFIWLLALVFVYRWWNKRYNTDDTEPKTSEPGTT